MCDGDRFCEGCHSHDVEAWARGETHAVPEFDDTAQRCTATRLRYAALLRAFHDGRDLSCWPEQRTTPKPGAILHMGNYRALFVDPHSNTFALLSAGTVLRVRVEAVSARFRKRAFGKKHQRPKGAVEVVYVAAHAFGRLRFPRGGVLPLDCLEDYKMVEVVSLSSPGAVPEDDEFHVTASIGTDVDAELRALLAEMPAPVIAGAGGFPQLTFIAE